MLRSLPWWAVLLGAWLTLDVIFVVCWIAAAETRRRRAQRERDRRRRARAGYLFGDGLAGEFPRGEP